MFICRECDWVGEEDQVDIKTWRDYTGNDEEIWFCPDCGCDSVCEVE